MARNFDILCPQCSNNKIRQLWVTLWRLPETRGNRQLRCYCKCGACWIERFFRIK